MADLDAISERWSESPGPWTYDYADAEPLLMYRDANGVEPGAELVTSAPSDIATLLSAVRRLNAVIESMAYDRFEASEP